jgi:hypothetical protein
MHNCAPLPDLHRQAVSSYEAIVKSSRYQEATLTRMPRSCRLKPHAARLHQHPEIVAHSVISDGAHVSKVAALVVGNNNVAPCPFACILQAYRLFGVGAEILRRAGFGASYRML